LLGESAFFLTLDYISREKNPKDILVFCSLIRTFAPVKPKYKQNYGRLPGGKLQFVMAGDGEQSS
jgi:hypothetical protein